jgi:hypothetical protein
MRNQSTIERTPFFFLSRFDRIVLVELDLVLVVVVVVLLVVVVMVLLVVVVVLLVVVLVQVVLRWRRLPLE